MVKTYNSVIYLNIDIFTKNPQTKFNLEVHLQRLVGSVEYRGKALGLKFLWVTLMTILGRTTVTSSSNPQALQDRALQDGGPELPNDRLHVAMESKLVQALQEETVPRVVLAGPLVGAESVQTPEKTWAAVERSAADRAAADIGEAIVEHNILQKH